MDESVSLSLFIYGLGVVVALGAAVLIRLIVGTLSLLERAPAPQTAAAKVAPANTAATAEDVPAHHLVAIAAAAHAVLGAHRIVHIGRVANGPGWSAEGRMSHHGSHHPSGHH